MTDDEIIDQLLARMNSTSHGSTSSLPRFINEELKLQIDPARISSLEQRILKEELVEGYESGALTYLRIIEKGRKIGTEGGYISYLKRLKEEEEEKIKDKEYKSMQREKLKWDFRTRWIAIISMLISLISITLSILNYTNKK